MHGTDQSECRWDLSFFYADSVKSQLLPAKQSAGNGGHAEAVGYLTAIQASAVASTSILNP